MWRFLAALLLPQGSVLALPGPTAGAPLKSVLASLGSLARYEGSAWVSFPASSPEPALRRCEESQKQAMYSGQAVDYLLALASDFRRAGSFLILVGPESPRALERLDRAGSLSAHLAILLEHFRWATV